MEGFFYIIIAMYGFSLLVIFLYSVSQFALMLGYLRSKKTEASEKTRTPVFPILPRVTIQLPVYNERYVMHRLLQAINALDYDRSKLQVQVLDDSTDDSVADTAKLIKDLAASGLHIEHVRRQNRDGFKAGALKHGLYTATGEFIAIFDADFVPGKNWLLQTLQGFTDPKIGMVQTRWAHLNRNYSLLTRMQAFALDIHFTMEQKGRNTLGHFINFNGTAGIWRKECIIDAGNWSGNTLTEDLDLSYRAQLKGWQFNFLEQVEAPAELPVVLSAARSQQFRWNKGGAENMVQHIRNIFSNDSLSFGTKWQSLFHLGNSSIFFFILVVSVLSVPVTYLKHAYPGYDFIFGVNSFFVSSTIMLFCCHWVAYSSLHGRSFKDFIAFVKNFISFFTLALGFSYHNSKAIAEAYTGKRSAFIRTPKFNIVSKSDTWRGNVYLGKPAFNGIIVEILLFAYFLFGLCSSLYLQDYSIIPFQLMLCIGFGYISFGSLSSRL